MRESKIEGYLRAEIAKLGGWCEKHTSPGTRGAPDNIVMWGGYSLNGIFTHERDENGGYRPVVEFIETKAPGGELSVLQQRDHERRRAMGFQVHVIWNEEQAEAYLLSRGKTGFTPAASYKVGDIIRDGNRELRVTSTRKSR